MSYSFTGLGFLPKHLGQQKAQEKKLGCKLGAEYTSKGWRCREQNPTVQKQKKYQDALRIKALAKKEAPKAKAKKLTPQRAFELLRQGRARVAAAKAAAEPGRPTVASVNGKCPAGYASYGEKCMDDRLSVSAERLPNPAKDVAIVAANEESLVAAEESDEGGLGLGTLLAGAAALAAVGGIAYLLLRNKGGGAAPSRTSAKRSNRRSSPVSTRRSSARSTLPSGTAVMPNRSGTTKRGRWWLYSAPSGNYLLTTKHHSGGSVPITIDDVTHGSAKRLGYVTAPWPSYASQADDLVQQVRVRPNARRVPRLSDGDRELWVMNTEGLYRMWKSSRKSKRDFIRDHRSEIDAHIRQALASPR